MSESHRRQKVFDANRIEDVVAEYFPLRHDVAGLRAVCPFHNDDDDTFRIDPAAKRFQCSACGNSGDVVDFIRMYEGVTESEAIDMLEARPKS